MLLEETPKLTPPMQNSSSPLDNEPEDIKKLLKWQEDRQARRMRGEYESAVLHLSELINSNRSTYLNLRSVKVEGATNTRQSFLGFIINPILSSEGGKDLEGVLHKTRQISDVLQRTDIFKSVDAYIERSRDPLTTENDLQVIFKAKEKGRVFLNSSTQFGNNEASGSITARVRNVFGGAETLEGNMSVGTTTKKSFTAILSAPITSDLGTRADLTVYGLRRDNSTFASSSEELRGLKALVRTGTLTTGMNEYAYEAVLRNIGGLTTTASLSMREAAGLSSKSALSHTYVFDSRDSPIAATRGAYFKARSEYAGLGGDAQFVKAETEGQVSRPIISGLSASFAMRSGIMSGLGSPVLFSDRFQLGGPTSVRSFKHNGLGPRDGLDSLGGNIFWSAGVSLVADIPKKPHWPVKLHTWVNAGRLDNMDKSCSLVENVRATVTRPSVSAGVGLVYRFDPVRVEVNLGVPLVASKSDNTRRGIQVGMGLEFL